MVDEQDNTMDASSIKSVSTLRSRFEQMNSSKPAPKVPPSIPPRLGPTSQVAKSRDELSVTQDKSPGRISLDLPRPGLSYGVNQQIQRTIPSITEGNSRPNTPKPRPLSMGPLSPTRTAPQVTIESPKSPPKYSDGFLNFAASFRNRSPGKDEIAASSRPHTPVLPTSRPFKIPSRATTPGQDPRTVTFDTTSSETSSPDPKKADTSSRDHSTSASSRPPPIDRSVKPRVFHSPQPQPRKGSESLSAPLTASDFDEGKISPFISPFNTPPSEPESPTNHGSPPYIPDVVKPRPFVASAVRDNYFNRPSNRVTSAERTPPPRPPRPAAEEHQVRLEAPPTLPPRHKSPIRRPPPEPPIRRSIDQAAKPGSRVLIPARSSLDQPSSSRLNFNDTRSIIPPRLPAKNKDNAATYFPPPPPTRAPTQQMRSHDEPDRYSSTYADSDEAEEEQEHSPERMLPSRNDFPDMSRANRREPRFPEGPNTILTRSETKLFAVCGDVICTTGYLTRAWNISTGQEIMTWRNPDETVKGTAIAFKPASNVDNEGERVWIGTNTGELYEIDIPTGQRVELRNNAHMRCNILKIHRHKQYMWTIDEDGKLLSWSPDETGSPSLLGDPVTSRVPPKAGYLLVIGTQVWVAMGKALWVYEPDFRERNAKCLTPQALSQPLHGDITAGTILTGQPDRVYFGHEDGKISIYSRKDFSFIDSHPVSQWKISALVGVGGCLWASYSKGLIQVFDVSKSPWHVMKDFKAHGSTVASLQVDGSSIWKLDRLHVVSLGTDNGGTLQIWDGMMTDDWLDADLMQHETDYCDFNDMTASVLTWNAGACKPSKLRQDEQDENFFREFLRSTDPPDIIVFGYQELVDLEDKKVTAKSLFKSRKKGDAEHQEKMSHQYRAWRDYLARVIDENMPSSSSYQLLHTANLIGLFTCVFVKDSIRGRISLLGSAQVKLGMGGLHGNKGSLLVRFMVDDSSLCFLNCHIAAGQSHTQHRNKDIANIMEATELPVVRDSYRLRTGFAGIGGDGSMVLDHDICVLNGDLNYRIDSIPRGSIIGAIATNNLAKLLERDQLLNVRQRNAGFRLRAFTELPITFPPTYKYDVGTDIYDSSDKKRSPAWCDRIMYCGRGISAHNYRTWQRPKTSDHRPVTLNLRFRIRHVRSEEEVERCRQEGLRRLDEWTQQVGWSIKHDYLVNVLGLSKKEATAALNK